MAGRGRPPKMQRQNKYDRPIRGEWSPTQGIGWQYGDIPKPPAKLLGASTEAWRTWMGSWFAAHWIPEDLPGLRVVILLYDQVQRGEFQRAGELRIQMDNYGITPKGAQDRRWVPPRAEVPLLEEPEIAHEAATEEAPRPSRYAGLKVVGGNE